ncbi:hypothetical protein BsWGS_18434 [Bradybaena similaris]
MCAGLYLALGVLTVLLTSQCHGQGSCPTGWFGPKCQQQCHCNKSRTCDVTNGNCPAGDFCAWEYIGPGCQYLNVGCRMRRRTPQYIYDCDDATCNPVKTNLDVIVETPANYQYMPVLFRIVVNDPSSLNKFKFIVDSVSPDEECLREVRYEVSPTSVDVHCDNFFVYNSVRLTGDAVGALCSVHIIIGRNIALKQRTKQSSNSSTHPEWGISSKAVDGNRRNVFDEKSSCSQTAVQKDASWTVYFELPSLLTNAEVYNRDVSQLNLADFRLNTDFSQGRVGYIVYPVYHSPFIDPHTSTYATILLRQGLLSELTLCEVEIYGEPWCQENTWGLFCENRCACTSDQRCNSITGKCAAGCPVRKYGFVCNKQCHQYCDGACSNRQGLCKCKPGRTAKICIKDCLEGKYGLSCEFNCSTFCIDGICNAATGFCNCMHGRKGKDCSECQDGKYGDNCQLNCSKFCSGNKCNAVDGSCTCMYNRLGPECAECPAGRYGETCNLTCPANCLNNVCDSVTGKCASCDGNYSLDFCTDCLPGTYGGECTLSCPLYCADHKCNRTTGRCFSCAGHHTGENCTDCARTYYTPKCDIQCSPFCLNTLCNVTTGICFHCVTGYTGKFCNKEIEEQLKPIYTAIVLAPATALSCVFCFCCGCCLCCFVTPQEEPEEEEEEDDETVVSTLKSTN